MFVLLKLTDACNMACSYCCMGGQNSSIVMSNKDAIKTISEVIHYFSTIDAQEKDICFHGGEPSLLSPNYLRQLFTIIKEADSNITISMQSNMLFISNELLDVLVEYDVRLSTSIDGPEHLHNVYRKDKLGNGSFQKIMSNIKKCSEAGLKLGVICTLNKTNYLEPNALYTFFKELNLPYKINWVHKIGNGLNSSVNIECEEITYCIKGIINCFLYDESPTVMDDTSREFLIGIIAGKMVSCAMKGACQKEFICVEANGDVYPCDAFSYLPNATEFCYGNILSDGQSVFTNNKRHVLSQRDYTTFLACASCEYQHLCHGGCLLDTDNSNRLGTASSFCSAYKEIFDFCSKLQTQNNLFLS